MAGKYQEHYWHSSHVAIRRLLIQFLDPKQWQFLGDVFSTVPSDASSTLTVNRWRAGPPSFGAESEVRTLPVVGNQH
jgi:hypothetical protein